MKAFRHSLDRVYSNFFLVFFSAKTEEKRNMFDYFDRYHIDPKP